MSVDKSVVECACGKTAIELSGAPIYCAICHCDDCQAAAEQLAALPSATPLMDSFRGTAYVLQRKDRYAVIRGKEHLQAFKLRKDSPTNRMIAGCCNQPMFAAFDNAQHWVSVYSQRFTTQAPRAEARIATKFVDAPENLPQDPPAHKAFPLKLILALLKSRVLMAVGK